MIQTFTVPKLNYVAFELVKIDLFSNKDNDEDTIIKQQTDGKSTQNTKKTATDTQHYLLNRDYKVTQLDVIYLAVLPEQFNYRLTARDNIQQTYEQVFLTRAGMQPERCTISGTFGDDYRYVAGTYMDGWTRLKQFQDNLVKASKQTDVRRNSVDIDKSEHSIYTVNYYDFMWQKFGHINIQDWAINGNATVNTNYIRYSTDFVIIGDLIISNGNDVLLKLLRAYYSTYESFAGGLTDLLNNNALNFIKNGLMLGEGFLTVADALNASLGEFSKIASVLNNTAKSTVSGVLNYFE